EKSAQYKWFVEQLAKQEWLEADWRFVLVHQPPFSQGWQGYHGEESVKTLILNTAEAGKIDFVVSGHTHDYERLSRPVGNQKIHFLIVGGAGGGLEPESSSDFPEMDKVIKAHHIARFHITGKKATIKILGLDNAILDSLEFSK
ncbi:MAG TPA: metallophosphoesterase, partial [Salinimicrobium sp.]|nr:metallophosphoesterase [Salinimicrobium sp.]